MARLQAAIVGLRRVFPRGWAPVLSMAARLIPSLRSYRARLLSGDELVLDLREPMCLGLFLQGGQPHEYGAEKLFKAAIREGDSVLDVGANVGVYTRLLSRVVGASGQVTAFEPLPSALRLLSRNTAGLSNVRIVAMAAGDRTEVRQYFVRRSGDTSSLRPGDSASVLEVNVTRIDDMSDTIGRVDFIKIDVEGFEIEVLRGARHTIERWRPVVYFEYLDDMARERQFSVETFRAYFKPLRYALAWVEQSSAVDILFSDTPTSYLAAIPESRSDLNGPREDGRGGLSGSGERDGCDGR